jgi:hypothetical protein
MCALGQANRRAGAGWMRCVVLLAAVGSCVASAHAQDQTPTQAPAQTPAPAPAQTPPSPTTNAAPQPAPSSPAPNGDARLLAIIPLDTKIPGFAQEVTGAMNVTNGRAFLTGNGTVTAGAQTTQVTLPYRGTLRVCTSSTVKLSTDTSVPAGEVPGLLMAMDHGAVEASFATGRNSDILMTPDFRILIGGPGTADVKVRLGQGGDTCVDNGSDSAAYVLVSSVFDAGAYRVQAGQRVMFQHGNLQQVVDQEKEPCGCPPPPKPDSNDFPLAQSEGLAPLLAPKPAPVGVVGHDAETIAPLVHNATVPVAQPAASAPAQAPAAPATPAPPKKQHSAFVRFFRRLFGAEE